MSMTDKNDDDHNNNNNNNNNDDNNKPITNNTETKDLIPCPQCSKLLRKTSMARHIRELHPKQKGNKIGHTCNFCSKHFARKSNLTRHIEANHADILPKLHKETILKKIMKEKKFHCSECGLSFKQKCHFMEHIRIHQGLRFSCRHCGKSFSRQTTLNQHIRSVHNRSPDGEKEFSSEIDMDNDYGAWKSKELQSSHSTCTSVAFLPHEGHVDFLHSCGNITCRDRDAASASNTDNNSSHLSLSSISTSHYEQSSTVNPSHDHSHEHTHIHHQQHSSMVTTDTNIDHSLCTKVAYLKHDDHIDFLHSCGSLFCQDNEVEFGVGEQLHENLRAFKLHSQTQSNNTSKLSNGFLHYEEESHSSCQSVAFLPHEGHVDFLRNCGSISCRDDHHAHASHSKPHDISSFSTSQQPFKRTRLLSPHDDHDSGGMCDSTCTSDSHDHSHGHHQHLHSNPLILPEDEVQCNYTDHSNCKKIAYLRHEDHVDFLHSCGSLFCHNTEVALGEGQQKCDNLCMIDEELVSSFLDLGDDKQIL